MNPRIEAATVNILNGVLTGNIPFDSGLNIIGGENGTLKTKLLQEIKKGQYVTSPAGTQIKIQAISPKRNSERRAIDGIIQQLHSQNRTFNAYVTERLQAQLVDAQFQNYPSIGELFVLVFDHRMAEGTTTGIEQVSVIAAEFNEVISAVFPEYKLQAEWKGQPHLTLLKGKTPPVPIEALSLGEQEVLSLITNLYASRDEVDVFLIDEPEVHLNWHLEERLFRFLLEFGNDFDKQVIVATHSRVVFSEDFLPRTTFLYWTEQGQIDWGSEIPDHHRRRLTGEAVQIIRLGTIVEGTYFVEDQSHERVVNALAAALGAEVIVVKCGNAPNVRTLFIRSKADGGWSGTLFLEDGDNEGTLFPGEDSFLHLDKYCLENYLLDMPTAAAVTGNAENELLTLIHSEILNRRDKILGKNKFLDFLIDGLTPKELTAERLERLDASIIIEGFLNSLSITFEDYLIRYIEVANDANRLDEVFPKQLVDHIRTVATPEGGSIT